jgi:ATP-dependent Clp protease protease subunit
MIDDDEDIMPGYHTGALNDDGVYVFMGPVNVTTIKPVVEWILYENLIPSKKKKELLLMICSEGGDLEAAFALIDTMRTSIIPIKTVGLGQIASCGLLIFMAGAKGRRVLTPNTSILSHQFSWGTEGKSHELFATMKEFTLTQARMIDHYRRCTGIDDETIRTRLLPAQDIWLSAEEALELNLCDSINNQTN